MGWLCRAELPKTVSFIELEVSMLVGLGVLSGTACLECTCLSSSRRLALSSSCVISGFLRAVTEGKPNVPVLLSTLFAPHLLMYYWSIPESKQGHRAR